MFFKLLIVTACLVWATNGKTLLGVNPYGSVGGKIVGGESTTIKEYPYACTMQYNGYHRCGGSLMSTDTVVTAAHCVVGTETSNVTFRVGSTNREEGGQLIKAKQCTANPKYISSTIEYDVAVCTLEYPIPHHPEFRPVTLPKDPKDSPAGTPCWVAGWGNTLNSNESSIALRHVEVQVVDRESCQKDYEGLKVTETMMCAGTGGGKDACQGDSGGPLVVDETLIGIVSWGRGCALPEYPGVYSNVENPEMLAFIRQFV